MSLAGALEGIRVLDLSRLLPGPFLTMVLADLGADVIKIEDPRLGDYLRSMGPAKGGMSGRYWAVNRGKRSVALNLKDNSQRDQFLGLVETADVVVESFRPGVMDKLGIGYAQLSERRPGLVVCSISGYGQDGPYRDRAGHDLNYISLAGVLAMGGDAGGAPAMPGVQIADMAGGALWGLSGVLAALHKRAKTGEGSHLDISMAEGALALLAAEFGNLDCTDKAASRGQETLNGGLACYQVYRTKDDRYLSVGGLEPKFWIAFNQTIGRKPDLSELAGGAEVQAEVRAQIQKILATRTRDEWQAVFANVDACVEPVFELQEVRDLDLHRQRELFFEQPVAADTTVLQVRTPLGAPVEPRPAPTLGEHTEEILGELVK